MSLCECINRVKLIKQIENSFVIKFKAPVRHSFSKKIVIKFMYVMEMCLIIIHVFILIVCDNINRIIAAATATTFTKCYTLKNCI